MYSGRAKDWRSRPKGGKDSPFKQSSRPRGECLPICPSPAETLLRDSESYDSVRLATAATALEAYRKACARPGLAFGSVDLVKVPVYEKTAEAVSILFVECVVHRSSAHGALESSVVRNLRVRKSERVARSRLDYKRVRVGFLAQSARRAMPWATSTLENHPARQRRRSTERPQVWVRAFSASSPTRSCWRARRDDRHWRGPMSRVAPRCLSVHKARMAGHDNEGSLLGSDAFFPFRDGVDQGRNRCLRDRSPEAPSATRCDSGDEHNIAMVLPQEQFRQLEPVPYLSV